MFWSALAIISFISWIYLTIFHHGFWRGEERLTSHRSLKEWPPIAAIIPARNEGATIGPVITAHMNSAYPGPFHVILVDDQSTDNTAEIAQKAADDTKKIAHSPHLFTVVRGQSLPQGWSGKVWAMAQGVEKASEIMPDARAFLFTDADIKHASTTLARLVAKADADSLALVSLMARLDSRGLWGEMLVPAFIYFFQKLYPFPASNNHWKQTAAAAGGCMLVDKRALENTGAFEVMKGALIDDCTLAAQIKGNKERPIWIGLADEEVISMRDNRSLRSIWNMVARTAFTQLDYSWTRLIAAMVGMVLIYLGGLLSLLAWPYHGDTAIAALGAGSIGLMMQSYWPTIRLYGLSFWRTATLPFAAIMYVLMSTSSAIRHAAGSGGRWKGRTYPPSSN